MARLAACRQCSSARGLARLCMSHSNGHSPARPGTSPRLPHGSTHSGAVCVLGIFCPVVAGCLPGSPHPAAAHHPLPQLRCQMADRTWVSLASYFSAICRASVAERVAVPERGRAACSCLTCSRSSAILAAYSASRSRAASCRQGRCCRQVRTEWDLQAPPPVASLSASSRHGPASCVARTAQAWRGLNHCCPAVTSSIRAVQVLFPPLWRAWRPHSVTACCCPGAG